MSFTACQIELSGAECQILYFRTIEKATSRRGVGIEDPVPESAQFKPMLFVVTAPEEMTKLEWLLSPSAASLSTVFGFDFKKEFVVAAYSGVQGSRCKFEINAIIWRNDTVTVYSKLDVGIATALSAPFHAVAVEKPDGFHGDIQFELLQKRLEEVKELMTVSHYFPQVEAFV